MRAFHYPVIRLNKKSKYGNKKTEYAGEVFDSKKEAEYAHMLDLLASAADSRDRVVSYERQVRYKLEVNGVKICTYVLDFLVTYDSGHVEHVDVKGMRTAIYKLKKKLMLAVHGIEIKEV